MEKTVLRLLSLHIMHVEMCSLKLSCKVKTILKGSLDLIPSPSVKIQIMGRKVCLRCKGKTLLDIFVLLLFSKVC